jgi:hypothetical protein
VESARRSQSCQERFLETPRIEWTDDGVKFCAIVDARIRAALIAEPDAELSLGQSVEDHADYLTKLIMNINIILSHIEALTVPDLLAVVMVQILRLSSKKDRSECFKVIKFQSLPSF